MDDIEPNIKTADINKSPALGVERTIPAEADFEKRTLELEKLKRENVKLELEQKALLIAQARPGRALEWLKAGAVPAALIGAAVAFYVGLRQTGQIETGRQFDRYDKALVRLANTDSTIRLAAVSAISSLLQQPDIDASIYQEAFTHLVDSALREQDELVRTAELAAIGRVKYDVAHPGNLNEAIARAINLNRQQFQEAQQDLKQRAEKYALDNRERFSNEWQSVLLKSPANQGYSSSIREKMLLSGTVVAFLAPIVKQRWDFRNIYCEGCNFSNLNRPKADFSYSHLVDTNFDKAILNHAKFERITASGISFTSANLNGAVLNILPYLAGDAYRLPYFKCAKLIGADLTGSTIGIERMVAEGERHAEYWITEINRNQVDNRTQMSHLEVVLERRFHLVENLNEDQNMLKEIILEFQKRVRDPDKFYFRHVPFNFEVESFGGVEVAKFMSRALAGRNLADMAARVKPEFKVEMFGGRTAVLQNQSGPPPTKGGLCVPPEGMTEGSLVYSSRATVQ